MTKTCLMSDSSKARGFDVVGVVTPEVAPVDDVVDDPVDDPLVVDEPPTRGVDDAHPLSANATVEAISAPAITGLRRPARGCGVPHAACGLSHAGFDGSRCGPIC